MIVYLIPEPELYFYLTLAEVLDWLDTQFILTMFLELPYLEGLLCHFLIIAKLTLPYVQQILHLEKYLAGICLNIQTLAG